MANAIKLQAGTPIVLANTGGDYTFNLKALANGAGRISAQVDLGAVPRPYRYDVRVKLTAASALSVSASNVAYVYIATSDGTVQDGDKGTSDAALSALTECNNMRGVLLLTPDDTGTVVAGSVEVPIVARYVSIAIWNALGQALANSDGASYVRITPVWDEIQ
ncbi:MAG: hypothetical protein HUU17_12955 [Chthonomonadales bacterium]|nr:hypothetical protein [Chthonomonadales bacterium]